MRTSSCKAKGRRACAEVKELLHKYAPDLRPGDIEITSSGACGEDIKLSPAAREKYPFVIECKNQETISIWKALEQAEGHLVAVLDKGRIIDVKALSPVLFFRRNRSKLYVALDAEEFVRLIS